MSNAAVKPSAAVSVAIPNQLSTNLEALDEKVKSTMMEKGQRMISQWRKTSRWNGKAGNIIHLQSVW